MTTHEIGDFTRRKEKVLSEIRAAVAEADFGTEAEVAVDEGLLDTVTNLVEIPFGVCGRFDDKFLAVPEEVLITSMREHQKYFPVVSKEGTLLPGFVAVNNTRVLNTGLHASPPSRVLAELDFPLFLTPSLSKPLMQESTSIFILSYLSLWNLWNRLNCVSISSD